MRVEADSIKYTFDSEVVEIKNVMIEGHPEEFRSLINLKEIPNFSPEIKHLTEEQPKPYIDLEALQRGMELFTGFAETWVINFDKDGEQPDRSRMTQDLAIHDPHEVLAFVYHCGGLIHACITVLRTPQQNEKNLEFIDFCVRVGENMAQVSSILFPPLSDYMEYPFKFKGVKNV